MYLIEDDYFEMEADYFAQETGFVGNHHISDVPYLEQAIKEYHASPDCRAHVSIGEAFTHYNSEPDPDFVGLYRDGEPNLSAFWRIFDRIKDDNMKGTN